MKNKIKYIIACSLLFTASCKDYLKEELVSGVTYNHYETEEGIESALNSVYAELRGPLGNERQYLLCEYGTDTYTEAVDGGGNKVFNNYSGGLNAGVGLIHDYWTGYYRGINTANICIDKIPKVKAVKLYVNEADRNRRIGEAKFLRAYYYFILVQQFGRIPLETKGNLEVKAAFKRAPVADVYRQIIKDLREAIVVLRPKEAEYGRATIGAAQHLLAKVYLTRGSAVTEDRGKLPTDADSAIYYAEQVIASPQYQLEADYASVFRFGNERNKEVVFSVVFSRNPIFNADGQTTHLYFQMVYEGAGSPNSGMIRDLQNGRPYRRLRPTDYQMDVYNRKIDSRFYKSYKMLYICNSLDNIPKWTAASAPSPDKVGKPKFGLGDSAIYLTLNKGISAADRDKRPYTLITRDIFTNSWFPTLNKYLDPGRADYNATQGGRDYNVMRLAETYLIAAEGYARNNNFLKAAELVNVVRKRAAYKEGEQKPSAFVNVEGGLPADLTKSTELAMQATPAEIQADLVTFFLDERAREMNGEMWRRFDLVRVEQFQARVKKYNPAASNVREFHKLRPIPQRHIDLLINPGPATEEQNEGY